MNYEDNIKLAMRTMRKRGGVARLNVMGCCRSCITADGTVWGDIDESLHEVIPVVYHYGGQGNRIDWDNDQYFYLNHDNKGAEMVTKCLTECGVPYEWNGNEYTCVKVLIHDPLPTQDSDEE